MNAPAEKISTPVEKIRAYHAELRTIRRDIHAHPELAFQENRTSQLVAERLAAWGIEVHRGLAKTGLVGVVKGRKSASGRAIGLRADMDCLPMHETSDIPHKSTHAGRMHACGHDGHTTMLLGAARYLQETRNFDGTAYLIFQPAEEGGGGGKVMVEEGLFERFPANEVYAVHNWPGLPPGQMAVRPGPGDGGHRRDRDHGARQGRARRDAAPHRGPGGDHRAGHLGAADHRQPQRQPARCDRRFGLLDGNQPDQRVQRDPGLRQADRHGAQLPPGNARHGRGAHQGDRRRHREGDGRQRGHRVQARLSVDHQHRARSAVRGESRRARVRQAERVHRRRADHGRRGFLLHAAGAARAPMSSSARAAGRTTASCTTRATTSTTR